MLSKLQSTYFIEQETWFVPLCAHYAHTLQYTDAEDFHQETRLLMWRLHDRLDSLPLREHQLFVTCCLKHLFLKFRQHDLQQRRSSVYLMDLSSVEHERVLETEVEPVATIDMDAWLSNLENEALYIHLAALNLSQHRLIESVYILRQTDVQIGVALKISSATVKMRRHRLLATLRNGLKASKPSRRL